MELARERLEEDIFIVSYNIIKIEYAKLLIKLLIRSSLFSQTLLSMPQ